MMLFISEYPDHANEKDGAIQRIKAIDDSYFDIERSYLQISLRKNLTKIVTKRELVTIYHLNLFLHVLTILQFFFRANFVYVHSIMNSIYVLPVYFFKKIIIITDMHGAVPEELAYSGNPVLSKLFEVIESIVIRRSSIIISVTNAMAEHFTSKYGRIASQDLVIPIINLKNLDYQVQQKIRNVNQLPLVIYAGGVQKWQNVPLMLDAVKINKRVKYRFLTGAPEVLRKMADSVGLGYLDIQSVPAEKVFDHYKAADYGFLLRDDHLLNRVACPTKAIEYMSNGVIPIVQSEEIGDLKALGYKYITLNAFLSEIMPSNDEFEKMIKINIVVTTILAGKMSEGLLILRSLTCF